ncbi:MAG: PDZ domain-containing protein [Gemmatimonadota bacterium]
MVKTRWSHGGLLLAICAAYPAVSHADTTATPASSASVSEIRYEVTFDASTAEAGILRVGMSFRVDREGPVVLSLPAWTPGSYELDNFARYIRNFAARAAGQPIRWDKVDFDSWRVHPTGAGTVTVSFDYAADTLDTGMAWSAPDFAFFNGTNIFLYPENQALEFAARVAIHTEPDWRVATGLTPAGTPGEYTADSYHELVDMPTFVGRFDLDSAEVEGRWYRLATYPPGTVAGESRERMWDEIRRMLPPMAAVFDETPWDDYTVLMVFGANYPGASALEHRSSHLGIYATGLIGNPVLPLVMAHEIFHAWNVKRLRPAELVPYRYDRAQPTELLWISEGITDYYADLALVRSGILSKSVFYQITAGKIATVAAAPPVALEDASLSTWIEPTDGTATLYYPKGSLAGLLLDILIRDASDNRSSLDGVMRQMYREAYKNGEGFTSEGWWQAVSRAAGDRSFDGFYARYVDGREPYPWAEVLPLAGLVLTTDTTKFPRIGVSTTQDSAGIRVVSVAPSSAAAAAGVQPDDHLLRVGDVEVDDASFGAAFRSRYAEEPEGSPLEIEVRRGAETLTLRALLRFAVNVTRSVREDANASPKAVRIREGILEGRVDE